MGVEAILAMIRSKAKEHKDAIIQKNAIRYYRSIGQLLKPDRYDLVAPTMTALSVWQLIPWTSPLWGFASAAIVVPVIGHVVAGAVIVTGAAGVVGYTARRISQIL